MSTRNLLDGCITYEEASKKDRNILSQLAYVPATQHLYQELWSCRNTICSLTRHHLRLSRTDSCEVLPMREWIRGSFNICIPVEVKSESSRKKLILRCPMQHKLAESQYPGTIDEKLSCEAGTYIWMQRKCPDVRIPFLYGFGFSNHRHFTHENQRPFYIRLAQVFRRSLHRLIRHPDLSKYTKNPTLYSLPTAYMLLEYIDSGTGQMLSETWDKWRDDPIRQERLYHGIAHMMLSLARIPQEKIGALRFHDDCTVTLSNRPLTCAIMMLENEGTPRNIHRNVTYSYTEPFVSDMITLHDNYFLSNPNATYSASDCRGQMAVRSLLRAVSHHYIRQEYRNGPFVLQLSDFHASNIFVDEEWNVTCLIDLEWVCALPVEMLAVPYWLTGCAIDGLTNTHLDEFNKARKKFMLHFEKEEQEIASGERLSLSNVMNESWELKGVWFWYCLDSINAMLSIFEDHICPRFSSQQIPLKTEETLSRFWREDSERVVEERVASQRRYDVELRREFGEETNGSRV